MPLEKRTSIDKPALLLVEGDEEVGFFGALLKHLGISEIQIMKAGKTRFRDNLSTYRLMSGFDSVRSIGVVRDADDSARAAFDSVRDSLKHNNLPQPNAILMPSTDTPRTMVLIMPPDGEGTGRMLEDLCWASMMDDPAMPCVAQYFECLAEKDFAHRPTAIAKARVHAFLASREEPDLRLGEAAGKGYWNFDSPVFEQVKNFLQQVAM